jgi:hypothetical protein
MLLGLSINASTASQQETASSTQAWEEAAVQAYQELHSIMLVQTHQKPCNP